MQLPTTSRRGFIAATLGAAAAVGLPRLPGFKKPDRALYLAGFRSGVLPSAPVRIRVDDNWGLHVSHLGKDWGYIPRRPSDFYCFGLGDNEIEFYRDGFEMHGNKFIRPNIALESLQLHNDGVTRWSMNASANGLHRQLWLYRIDAGHQEYADRLQSIPPWLGKLSYRDDAALAVCSLWAEKVLLASPYIGSWAAREAGVTLV